MLQEQELPRGGREVDARNHSSVLWGRLLRAAPLASIMLLAACGGGGDGSATNVVSSSVGAGNGTAPVDRSVGGNVSGLAGTGLILQNNGADDLAVSANGAFAFAKALPAGAAYRVSVKSNPSAPPQSCFVSNASGTVASANIADVVVQCANSPPSAPTTTTSAGTLYVGQIATFNGVARDPNGLALAYSWDFGDATSAAGRSASHAYGSAGQFLVTLTATNSQGVFSNSSLSVTVLATSLPAAHDNMFEPYCSGPLCGALDAHTYSGSGVGAWRYHNAQASAAMIDFTVNGVVSGQTVALVFSNGQSVDALSVPSGGSLVIGGEEGAQGAEGAQKMITRAAAGDAHTRLLQANIELAKGLAEDFQARSRFLSRQPAQKAVARAVPPPLGSSRTWTSAMDGTTHTAAVQQTCALTDGRNAVFWVDTALTSEGTVGPADLAAFNASFCGPAGGFARVTQLLGDVWGSAASSRAGLLHDSSGALLDLNVVLLDVPTPESWGGYFNAADLYTSGGNEAMVVFLNGSVVGLSALLTYEEGALIHEVTHLINFYQRSVVRGNYHDPWLEESSAMMSEDVVAPAVLSGYDETASRIDGYQNLGSHSGDISLVNWGSGLVPYYNLGGSLGALLNRRHGLAIYTGLITDCADGPKTGSSYDCLDQLIRKQGGRGFEDEFARVGASVFAGLPSTGLPWGMGFAATAAQGYSLAGESTAYYKTLPPAPAFLNGDFPATSHTFVLDRVSYGQSAYGRTGVVVPAGTTLIVVVRDEPK